MFTHIPVLCQGLTKYPIQLYLFPFFFSAFLTVIMWLMQVLPHVVCALCQFMDYLKKPQIRLRLRWSAAEPSGYIFCFNASKMAQFLHCPSTAVVKLIPWMFGEGRATLHSCRLHCAVSQSTFRRRILRF